MVHKMQVFHFLFSVYFLFVIIQFSNQKTVPSLKKYLRGGIWPPCPSPKLRLLLCVFIFWMYCIVHQDIEIDVSEETSASKFDPEK
jgi:hypothetical protein